MADVNANIGVNIDTSAALRQLKSLQRQISQFHTSIARSSESAAISQKSLQKNLLSNVNAIGAFSAELRTVKTSAESFTSALEGNKFSMREYFRYAGASTKTFGRLFKSEFDTIGKVAEERVKTLQTQYIKMGRNASGAMEAIAIRPTSLNMQDYSTRTAMAAQKQALFNQLMKQGSTNLLNFGKNTQWAGRQLMVGFTIPLTLVGSAATKTFMEMEAQAIKFKKVYGDLFTPQEETQQALEDIEELGKRLTKYGVAVSQTLGVAAEAAAAGFAGIDLQRQTEQSIRLSILGQVDYQKALETTISVQNAFGTSSDELAASIDFLNAVENQTVLSLDDVTTAIPKSAPIIQQLGGDIRDLAFFMTAMKEGGINASEGANALKSGLASMINPTGKAVDLLQDFGINVRKIVVDNKGDLKKTVIDFATALNQLDPLNRAQAIEQMFGKFQFARLSTLFANVTKEGNQASRVLDLANSSVEELSTLSEKELGLTAESSMNKFKKAVEDLKVALVPVGQAFLEAVTPILEFVGKALEKFGNLSDGTKKVITLITLGIAGLGPIFLMTFGLLANLLANSLKGAMILRNGYLRLTGQSQILGEQTQYLTMEQLEAAAAAHSLDQSHARLTQQFTAEASAVAQLVAAYQQATAAGQKFMLNNPGMMLPGARKGYANGVISVPGSGKGDTVPAMLTPGEAVIPAAMAKKYAPLIQGMIAGNIPGYMSGTVGAAGQTTQLDFARSDTATKAQKLVDELLRSGNGIENASQIIEETLQRVSRDTKISIGGFVRELDIVTQNLSGKQIPGSILSAAGRGARSFNASQAGVGTMSSQAEGNPVLIEEIARAKESSRVAQEAMINYYTSIGKDASEFSGVVKQAGDVHRAHVIDIRNNVDKMFMEAWDPNAWIAQSSTLNQVSNILQSSESTRDEYFKQLSEVNADESVIATIRDKITNNLALTEDELVVQKQVLERILASTSSMSKVAAGFGPQAAGAVAATDYLMQNPATQQGVGSRTQQQISRAQTNLNTAKFRGQQTFVPVTQAAQDVVDQTVLATARAAGTQSPSKRTIPIGEDIARGLEVGMQSRKDEVAAAGKDLGKAATQSTSRGASTGVITSGQPYTIQKTQGGMPLSQVVRGMPATPDITKKAVEQAKIMKISTDRLRSFDRNIMGASFAVSSLSGLASMSGGKLGTMAGTIAKVTGAMFALQAVTSLLTQTKLLELAQNRLSLARNAMRAVDIKAGGQVAGLLPKLAKFAFGLKTFMGPIGLATTAATGLYVAFRAIQKNRERERKSLEAFGDAIRNSTKQVESLGDFFGVTPTKTGLETTKPRLVVDKNTREQLEKFKSSGTFKEFAGTIEAVSKLSNKDATLALQAKGQELLGKGFSKEQVSIVLRAIQEEAGKTDLKINFAKIDVDELNNTLQSEMANKFAELPKFINDNLEKRTVMDNASGRWVTKLIPGKKIEAELKNSGTLLKTYLNGVTGMFQTGQISGEKFNALFGKSLTDLTSKVPQTRNQILLLDAAIDQMDSPLAQSAKKVKNLATKYLLLQAAALNAKVGLEQVNALIMGEENKTGPDMVRASLVMLDIEKQNAYLTKLQVKANKALLDSFKDLNTEKAKKKTQLDVLKQAQDYIALQEELVDIQNAPELKKYNDELERQDELLTEINKKIEATTEAQIAPLEAKLKANGYLIDEIANKEDAINEKYNLQIEALSKVQQINEEIASSEKERLSLADALSSGDISAAASIAQEARARAAASATGRAESSLIASRDNEINALGRNKLEKENKQIQLDIARIQRDKLDPLNDEKIAIEKNVTAQNELKSALEKSIEIRKSEITQLGLTKIEIDRAVTALDLAQNDNIDIKGENFLRNVLKGAMGDAEALELALNRVAKSS